MYFLLGFFGATFYSNRQEYLRQGYSPEQANEAAVGDSVQTMFANIPLFIGAILFVIYVSGWRPL